MKPCLIISVLFYFQSIMHLIIRKVRLYPNIETRLEQKIIFFPPKELRRRIEMSKYIKMSFSKFDLHVFLLNFAESSGGLYSHAMILMLVLKYVITTFLNGFVHHLSRFELALNSFFSRKINFLNIAIVRVYSKK